jgi:uncharacterized protein with HEPN domain
MPPEVGKRILDAYRACRAIDSFTSGLAFEDFERSMLIRSAVERQFEIVGEALGRAREADPSLVDALPVLPKIVGLRNRLIHGYDSVDDQIVWDLVRTKIKPLAGDLAQLLVAGGYSPEVFGCE